MTLNREWHLAHRMPAKATEAQRIAWHAEHEKRCSCREAPPSLRAKIDAYNAGKAAEGE